MTAPDQLSIETPEQVALEFPLAGVGSRFLALAIDMLLQMAIALLRLRRGRRAPGRCWADAAAGPWFVAVLVIVAFLLFYGYFAGFEAFWHGQTPGKRLIGLRVLSVTGRPARIDEAILRNLLRVIDQLPGVYAIGIVTMLVSSRNQRLGDLAAGTVVVHEKALSAPMMQVASPTAGVGVERRDRLDRCRAPARRNLSAAPPRAAARRPRDARPDHRRSPARAPRPGGASRSIPKPLIEALHARARTRGGRV